MRIQTSKDMYHLFLSLVCVAFVAKVRCNHEALYLYGTGNGDTIAPANDDGSTPAIPINNGFPFFASIYYSLYVNTNGMISFSFPVSSYTPNAFPIPGVIMAPFWADVDTRVNPGKIYYRQSNDSSIRNQATHDVLDAFPSLCVSNFTAQFVFIATWENVTFYGGSSTTPVNTFQCVLISDGVRSFAIFNYKSITWTTGAASGGAPLTGLGGIQAQVGFNAGDRVNFFAVPDSRTANIVNIGSTSNIDTPGRYIFRVDPATISLYACSSGYDCLRNNPCTKANSDLHRFYFAYGNDPHKFVQCDQFNRCFVMPCAPGTQWSEAAYTCVHQLIASGH